MTANNGAQAEQLVLDISVAHYPREEHPFPQPQVLEDAKDAFALASSTYLDRVQHYPKPEDEPSTKSIEERIILHSKMYTASVRLERLQDKARRNRIGSMMLGRPGKVEDLII